jgi:TPR repeat protein
MDSHQRRRLLFASILLLLVGSFFFWMHAKAPKQASLDVARTNSASRDAIRNAAQVPPTQGQRAPKKPFLQRGAPELPASDVPLAERLASLESAAETGDPDIGLALGMELRECLELDERYADLQARSLSAAAPSEVLGVQLDALDKHYEHCKGISPKVLKDYGHWIELAAKRGSIAARLAYPAYFGELLTWDEHSLDTAWIEDYKANSMAFLNSAANEGSVDALSQLGHLYQDGLVVPKDPVTAYAYEYAVYLTGLTRLAPKVLELWASDMSPEQVQAAQQQGTLIFERCCM